MTAPKPELALDVAEVPKAAAGAARTKEAAFAEIVALTADVVRHTRASQELAAESLIEKSKADAAAIRRSFVATEAIELSGHSTTTHTISVDRGKVEVVPIEAKK